MLATTLGENHTYPKRFIVTFKFLYSDSSSQFILIPFTTLVFLVDSCYRTGLQWTLSQSWSTLGIPGVSQGIMIVKTGTHYLDWNHWHWCLKKKWKLIYCLSSTLICTTSLSPLLTWAGTWYHYPTHCFYQGSCWRRDLVSDIYKILISSCPSMVSWNHCRLRRWRRPRKVPGQ